VNFARTVVGSPAGLIVGGVIVRGRWNSKIQIGWVRTSDYHTIVLHSLVLEDKERLPLPIKKQGPLKKLEHKSITLSIL